MFSGNENKAYCKTCKANRKNSHCVILILGPLLPAEPHLKDSAAQIHLSFIHVWFYLFLWLRMALTTVTNLPVTSQWARAVTRTGTEGQSPSVQQDLMNHRNRTKLGTVSSSLGKLHHCSPRCVQNTQQSLPRAGFQEFNHPVCSQGHSAPAPAWKQQRLVKFSVKNKNNKQHVG